MNPKQRVCPCQVVPQKPTGTDTVGQAIGTEMAWHSPGAPHSTGVAQSKVLRLCPPQQVTLHPKSHGTESHAPCPSLSWTEPHPDPCPGSQAESRTGAKPALQGRQRSLWPVLETSVLGWDSPGAGSEFSHLFNGPYHQLLSQGLKGTFAKPGVRRGL